MGNATIRYSAYDFLFDFNRNYASIFCRFRDTASYLSKVADFNAPHLHLAGTPAGGDRSRILRRSLAPDNYIPSAIVWCYVCDPTSSRFSRTPTCDRQTQTDTGPWLVPRMHSIAQ